MTTILRRGCLVICLLALACGAKPEPPSAPRPAGPSTCPVCGDEFRRDRAVLIQDPCGDASVCSEACAIRYRLSKMPVTTVTDTRPRDGTDSQPEEER
jgi:hypothetical protein